MKYLVFVLLTLVAIGMIAWGVTSADQNHQTGRRKHE